MKGFILICGLAAGGAMLLPAQTSIPLKVDVPFGFYVGDTQMPAGEYEVTRAAAKIISVREASGEATAFRVVVTSGGGTMAKQSSLVFRKYGEDRYFLGEIRHEGHRTGSWVPQSKLEKEAVTSTLVTSVKPVEVIILARTR